MEGYEKRRGWDAGRRKTQAASTLAGSCEAPRKTLTKC